MISQAIYDKLYHLTTLRRVTHDEAREIQSAIQQYINPKYSVCLRCSQQLKHGQKVITNYLSSVEVIENFTGTAMEETLLDEMMPLPAPEVDEVEADKVGCVKCRRKSKDLTTNKTKQ